LRPTHDASTDRFDPARAFIRPGGAFLSQLHRSKQIGHTAGMAVDYRKLLKDCIRSMI
jgi:hypothetical protein